MRQGPNGRRPRGRPNRKPHGGSSRPNNFDSGGPDGRVRGNAHQVYERYVGMARDALSAGDRVAAEAYYQHAEHYFRIVNSSTDPESDNRRPPRAEGNGRGEARRDDNRRDENRRDENRRGAENRGDNGQESSRASGGSDTRRQAQGREHGPAASDSADPNAADGASPAAGTSDGQGAKPRRGEDREGLDRVLSNEGRPPRRSRQRPPRASESADAAPRADRRGNGQDREAAPREDAESDGTSSEEADGAAPGDKTPGTEPVGA